MAGERSVSRRRAVIVAVLLFFLLLAAAWRFTSLNEWLDPEALIAIAHDLQDNPHTPLIVAGVYLISALVVFPVTLLNTVIVIAFGPLVGAGYAVAGATLSAAMSYGIGRWAGRNTVRRIAGERVNRLSAQLGRRGILAMTIVRLVPVAPFAVVNLVAGASHIGFRDFLIGSVFGLVPGIAATAIFVERAAAAIRDPGVTTIALLAIVLVLIAAAVVLLRRHLSAASEARRAGAGG
jgi:phospholipase D1/2